MAASPAPAAEELALQLLQEVLKWLESKQGAVPSSSCSLGFLGSVATALRTMSEEGKGDLLKELVKAARAGRLPERATWITLILRGVPVAVQLVIDVYFQVVAPRLTRHTAFPGVGAWRNTPTPNTQQMHWVISALENSPNGPLFHVYKVEERHFHGFIELQRDGNFKVEIQHWPSTIWGKIETEGKKSTLRLYDAANAWQPHPAPDHPDAVWTRTVN